MNIGDRDTDWQQALKLLLTLEETKSPLAKTYLNYLVPVSLDEQRFVFAVRLLHAQQMIEQRYLSYIRDSVITVIGSPREVVLVFDETIDQALPSVGTVSNTKSEQLPSGVVSQIPSQSVNQQGTTNPPTQRATQPGFTSPQPSLQSTQQFAVVSSSAQPLQTAASPSLSAQASQFSSLPNSQSVATQTVTLQPQQTAQAQQPLPQPEVLSSSNIHLEGVSQSVVSNTNRGSGLSTLFAPDTQSQDTLNTEPDSRFQFSNYVIGESNQLACTLSRRVAEEPGQYFNPLFIHGKSGLGKTHLLLSIKNYINMYLLDKRVVYAPIAGFVNDFTNAVAGDRDLATFKRKYHTCDVLLIDDVQYLEGKTGTTDALFEIFNMFTNNNKQIVLSADRHPSEISLDERFTSRFSQGITIDIQPPNHELKTAILKKYKQYYCRFLNIPEVKFSDEAIQRIVELSGSNIRELEGAVSNLIVSVAYQQNNQDFTSITNDDVENVLSKTFFHKNTRRVDIDMVMRAVESYFKISHAELLSEKRSKNISHPRQIAMYLIRRYTDMSYPEIGDSFNKDHTTVMYADRNIQAKMVEEVNVKVEVERIAEILTT